LGNLIQVIPWTSLQKALQREMSFQMWKTPLLQCKEHRIHPVNPEKESGSQLREKHAGNPKYRPSCVTLIRNKLDRYAQGFFSVPFKEQMKGKQEISPSLLASYSCFPFNGSGY